MQCALRCEKWEGTTILNITASVAVATSEKEATGSALISVAGTGTECARDARLAQAGQAQVQ